MIALLLAATLAPPFPVAPGGFWEYRETSAEHRGDVDVVTDEDTRFDMRGTMGRPMVVQTGGVDPAGASPIEIGPDWIRLGSWTGEEALPLPLLVGATRPADDQGRAGWVVEAEEELSVPAGRFKALRCALRNWRSESVLWIVPGIGVVRETQGSPGRRPDVDRVLLRASTVATAP